LPLNSGEVQVIKRCWIALLFGLIFGSLGTSMAFGEEAAKTESSRSEVTPTSQQLQTQISILQDQLKKISGENAALRQQPSATMDPDLLKAYVKAKQREYSYYTELMDANVQTFYAQEIASYVILILVFMVVVSGVLFSGFQLWKSVSIGVQSNSEFELSAGKVRVTSSVVGIVVLTISLVFLFIYTQQVYQIKLLDTGPSTKDAKSAALSN
jgi:hypothetical protein